MNQDLKKLKENPDGPVGADIPARHYEANPDDGSDLAAALNAVPVKDYAHYEVEVEDVNTMIVRGKSRSRYTKRGVIKGKSPNYKKAIVTLVEDDEIDFYKHI